MRPWRRCQIGALKQEVEASCCLAVWRRRVAAPSRKHVTVCYISDALQRGVCVCVCAHGQPNEDRKAQQHHLSKISWRCLWVGVGGGQILLMQRFPTQPCHNPQLLPTLQHTTHHMTSAETACLTSLTDPRPGSSSRRYRPAHRDVTPASRAVISQLNDQKKRHFVPT